MGSDTLNNQETNQELICSDLHDDPVWELDEQDSEMILGMVDNPEPAPAEFREQLAAYEKRFHTK
jgi:hypothetical protein